MQQFISGIVVALIAAVLIALLLFRKKDSANQKNMNSGSDRLEELSKLTGELAHEIKNPLSTIKINLKLISEELGSSDFSDNSKISTGSSGQKFARALRKVAVIQKEADRLEQILDGFLRYVEKSKLQLVPTNINELVSDMIDFYSPQVYSHSITVRQSLYGEQLICDVDVNMLKQVILNLFINAQQAMANGGELIVRTHKRQNKAVLQVSDTGCGIDKEKLQHIFEPYYSARPSGTGLGLATAKKIIEGHNGTITVESEVGKGTSFTIMLPLSDVDINQDKRAT